MGKYVLYVHADDLNSSQILGILKSRSVQIKTVNIKDTPFPDFLRGVPTITLQDGEDVSVFEGSAAFEVAQEIDTDPKPRGDNSFISLISDTNTDDNCILDKVPSVKKYEKKKGRPPPPRQPIIEEMLG